MDVPRILIVDDDFVMLAVIEKQLTEAGFIVVSASDARLAQEALERFTPDLIITDILMPRTSGLELISRIRSMYGDKIPILVLSALDEEDTVMEAFNLGAEDFLTKPIKAGELSVRVKRLLKRTK